MADEQLKAIGYCVKCKTKREFVGTVEVSRSGRRMAKGVCPDCGTNMTVFLKKEPAGE